MNSPFYSSQSGILPKDKRDSEFQLSEESYKDGVTLAESDFEANSTSYTSSTSDIDASSIIKLNNGDVLYMREVNR
jgi:glutamate-1-semialdehyde aminotransferase